MSTTTPIRDSALAPNQLSAQPLVERVPHELLLELFLLVLQEEIRLKAGSSHSRKPNQYPWILAAVCAQWRSVCLTNPRLWSYFDLSWHTCPSPPMRSRYFDSPCCSDDDSPGGPRSLPLEQLRLQLYRCREPTPIFLYGGMYCKCDDQLSLWKFLMPHSNRWAEVHFGYKEREHSVVMELIRGNTGFHSLQHITFCVHSIFYDGSIPFSPELNHSLTNIRSLKLRHLIYPRYLADFPWQRLTSLSLPQFDCNWNDLIKVLHQCQNLANLDILTLREYGSTADELIIEADKASVVLPHLTSFSLVNRGFSYGSDILLFLRLPALRSLRIFGGIYKPVRPPRYGKEEPEHHHEFVMNLINASRPPLAELNVRYSGGSACLTNLLENLPKLVSLTFEGDLDALVRILCQRPNSTYRYVCPLLQRLKLGPECDQWSLDTVLFLEMLASRVKDVVPTTLELVHIVYPASKLSEDDIKKLKTFLEGGREELMKDRFELRLTSDMDEVDDHAFPILSRTP